MAKLIDLTGRRFGRLTVIGRAQEDYRRETLYSNGLTKKAMMTKWLCRCDCGKEVAVIGGNLTHDRSKSCGCLRREKSAANLRELWRLKNDR